MVCTYGRLSYLGGHEEGGPADGPAQVRGLPVAAAAWERDVQVWRRACALGGRGPSRGVGGGRRAAR